MKESILQLFKEKPEQKLTVKQISHLLGISKSHLDSLKTQLQSLVKEAKITVDESSHYAFRDESRVLKGTIKIHARGFGFVMPEEKGKVDVFVPKRQLNYAMNGDVIMVESFRNAHDGRFEGRVVQILDRANKVIIGSVKKIGKQHLVIYQEGDTSFEILISPQNLNKAEEGDFVAVRVIQFPGLNIVALGEVINIIGDEFNLSNCADAILLKYRISREFPKEVKRELATLPEEVAINPNDHHRVDLSELPIITIDGIKAKDFDDAVCVIKRGKQYHLYVSIADVSEYVVPGSELDQEAYRRGTSIYLPQEAIPMLPHKLSDDLCSLKPYLPRLTLTSELHYDEHGNFLQARYYRSWIKSHKRATYEEVQAFLDGTGGKDFDSEVQKSIRLMKELAEKLMKQREARGALGFDLPEAHVVFNTNNKIIAIQKAERFFSHKLIEEFMIAANVVVGQYFTVHGLPQLYRIHDAPDPVKVKAFVELAHNLGFQREIRNFDPSRFFQMIAGNPKEFFMQTVFLRSLKQAVYDPENHGHYGLMLDDYCHFTSPIRRYPDLIVHRQLKSLLGQTKDGVLTLKKQDLEKTFSKKSKGRPLYDFQDLKSIGRQASTREREAMELEREVQAVHQAFFIKDYLHKDFCGRISRIMKHGMFVELNPYFVEGFLSLSELKDDYYVFDEKRMRFFGRKRKRILNIGDRIWVNLAHVNVESADIKLTVAEPKEPGGKKPKKKPGKK